MSSTAFNVHTIYSTFFGSLALGLLSHYMARKQKEPAIIFMVTGIIPFIWWLSIRCYKKFSLIKFQHSNKYNVLEVTLIAGAIALGLLFADQISKLIVSGFVKSFKRL
ncbi:threonine/serine exporter family protein [Staphylococcus aureus]